MPKMRILDAMPEHQRKRMGYQTRMMTADGSIDISPRFAQFFRRMGWAEDAIEEVAPEPAPAPDPTRAELMAIAEERGLELPSGYVSKGALEDLIREDDERQAGDEDGAA